MRIVYGLLAAFLILISISVIVDTVEQLRTGKGLPEKPNVRNAYIQGLFIPPLMLLAVGTGCGYLAFRRKRPKPESTSSRDAEA